MHILRNIACAGLAACSVAAHAASPSCQASASAVPPTVVELYTSEGCSSCPPADKWLSGLKGRSDVLALAFHVNYWDRLGWADRFVAPGGTERQHALAQRAGSSTVYTPQVLANGQDWRNWHDWRNPGDSPRLPAGAKGVAAATLAVTLARDGDTVSATVAPAPGTAARVEGYWAVVEDGHQSKVGAGENAGSTLRHDHVVRLYKPVPAWAAPAGQRAELTVSRGVPEHPRRVVFVVTDAATQRPLQAVALGC